MNREETTFLHVYFKNEFLLQYKRDTLYGVNDFICEYTLIVWQNKL